MKFKIFCALLFLSLLSLFTACNETPKPQPEKERTVTLIYAVSHNNLASDLKYNQAQILSAAPSFDPDKDIVMLYSYESSGCTLSKLKITKGEAPCFEIIKKYDTDVKSISPERVQTVLEDVISIYPQEEKTLFLWGHGLGPVNPFKYSHIPLPADPQDGNGVQSIELPPVYGYGGEYISDTNRTMEYMDVDQLADAIPDHKFKTIWFDCCYMASIEIAYELRNKCENMVAYPTEIMAEGLPYDLVLPHVVGSQQNLTAAAQALYSYFASKSNPVTVTVMDMKYVEPFALSVGRLLKTNHPKPGFEGVENYSRLTMPKPYQNVEHPYYDLMGWLESYAMFSDMETHDAMLDINRFYQKFVVYTKAWEKDFKWNPLTEHNYFGLSFYNFTDNNSPMNNYYKKLEFYNIIK